MATDDSEEMIKNLPCSAVSLASGLLYETSIKNANVQLPMKDFVDLTSCLFDQIPSNGARRGRLPISDLRQLAVLPLSLTLVGK
jgi:hypothetical protein